MLRRSPEERANDRALILTPQEGKPIGAAEIVEAIIELCRTIEESVDILVNAQSRFHFDER